VTAKDGSQADVTLVRVDYVKIPGDTMTEFAAVDLSIAGVSAQPFHYDEGRIAFQYADGADPYHPDDTSVWNVDPSDWVAVPPGLRTGTVASGKTVTGYAPLRVSPHSKLLITMSDADQTTKLAAWIVTAP
jgi:hypothetical protein